MTWKMSRCIPSTQPCRLLMVCLLVLLACFAVSSAARKLGDTQQQHSEGHAVNGLSETAQSHKLRALNQHTSYSSRSSDGSRARDGCSSRFDNTGGRNSWEYHPSGVWNDQEESDSGYHQEDQNQQDAGYRNQRDNSYRSHAEDSWGSQQDNSYRAHSNYDDGRERDNNYRAHSNYEYSRDGDNNDRSHSHFDYGREQDNYRADSNFNRERQQDNNNRAHSNFDYGRKQDNNYRSHSNFDYGHERDNNYRSHSNFDYGHERDNNYRAHSNFDYGREQDNNYRSHSHFDYGREQDNYRAHSNYDWQRQRDYSTRVHSHSVSESPDEGSCVTLQVTAEEKSQFEGMIAEAHDWYVGHQQEVAAWEAQRNINIPGDLFGWDGPATSSGRAGGIEPIEVYFKVLRWTDPDTRFVYGEVPLDRINAQLTVLNDAFHSVGFGFVLASYEYVDVDYINFKGCDYARDANTLRLQTKLRKGVATDLYIYTWDITCDKHTPAGYATYPEWWANWPGIDGAVLTYKSLPGYDNHHNGNVAVHEIGHWLGLYHTFEGNNCSEPTGGDMVDDTPAQAGPSGGCPAPSLTGQPPRDSCPNSPGYDPIHNHMDYTTDSCRREFTPGQVDRMWKGWEMRVKFAVRDAANGATGGTTTTDSRWDRPMPEQNDRSRGLGK